MQPGHGLAEHPMLYAGEGFNTIFLVNEGKVIWSYASAPGGEIDDVWMLSNGHILYAHSNFLEELTPKKEVVWHYALPPGTESHSLQPIGLDKVLFVQNGQPAKIIVMNKATKALEVEHVLDDAGANTHPQFRRIRMTAAGTYLAPYLAGRKVVEFDKDFKVVWTYPVADMGTPWTALRLRNGNTLIQDEHNKSAREVNKEGTIVWEFKQTDLPAGLVQRAPQTSERLANGNTVIFSPGKDVNAIQVVEVDQAKKVVWILQDWKDLGPATTAQFLDQPGIPETPGDLLH
jgi:outer membrane protein assembly factor BamB